MGDTMGDIWGGVQNAGQWAGNNMNWIAPVAGIGGSILGAALQGGQERSAFNQAAGQNLGMWQQTAYPNAALVDARALEDRGALGQARLGSYQNLGNQMAARGWGSGTGLGTRAAADIEKGYLTALGKANTELTKFKNTPMWGPPSSAYVTPTTGAGGAAAGKTTSLLDTALGFSMMSRMLGNNRFPQQTGPISPTYSYYGNSTPYNYGAEDIYSPYFGGGYGEPWDYGYSY